VHGQNGGSHAQVWCVEFRLKWDSAAHCAMSCNCNFINMIPNARRIRRIPIPIPPLHCLWPRKVAQPAHCVCFSGITALALSATSCTCIRSCLLSRRTVSDLACKQSAVFQVIVQPIDSTSAQHDGAVGAGLCPGKHSGRAHQNKGEQSCYSSRERGLLCIDLANMPA
jgi:hypothetical protein